MSEFLEKLKSGLQEAQQKFSATQQKFNAAHADSQAAAQRLAAAQTEYAVATQEFQAFQTLVNVQTRKEQPNLSATATVTVNGVPAGRPPAPPAPPNATVVRNVSQIAVSTSQAAQEANKPEGNKTEAVLMLLRQHGVGMTPGEIWKEMESQINNRAYLYSVLKRLKDRGEVKERRGKYCAIPKIEEVQHQELVQ
jgi:hypothetical protein